MFVGCPIFGRQGRGAKAYAPQTTRQGRSDLSIGRHIYPCGIHMGRMQYAPTLPAGDVSYLYPQRLPRTRHFLLLDLPFSMSPCRGVLNTPHKTTRKGRIQDDGKGIFFRGRRIQHRRRGRCPLTPTSFSCLDTGKRMRKENQGLTEAREFSRVPDPLVFSFPFFDLPSPYDSDRRYDCESRCDRATVYVRLEPVPRGLLH